MSCGVGCRHGGIPCCCGCGIGQLLWLQLDPLDRETPYATGVTLQRQKKKKKISETKSSYFEKINKADKPLPRLIKKKKERVQINEIRNEKEDTMDITEIQRV